MAVKKSMSRSRPMDSESFQNTEAPPALVASELPVALREVVEQERSRLMDAEAVLHCAVAALDAHDCWNGTGPYYQSVINTARTLIMQSIHQLDAVTLGEALRGADTRSMVQGLDQPSATRARRYAVRESVVAYLN